MHQIWQRIFQNKIFIITQQCIKRFWYIFLDDVIFNCARAGRNFITFNVIIGSGCTSKLKTFCGCSPQNSGKFVETSKLLCRFIFVHFLNVRGLYFLKLFSNVLENTFCHARKSTVYEFPFSKLPLQILKRDFLCLQESFY